MTMDMNIVREVVTVVSFVSFVGILAWVLDPRKRERFEEAARLPLEDGDGGHE